MKSTRTDIDRMLDALSGAERDGLLRLLPGTGDETVTEERRERIGYLLLISVGLDHESEVTRRPAVGCTHDPRTCSATPSSPCLCGCHRTRASAMKGTTPQGEGNPNPTPPRGGFNTPPCGTDEQADPQPVMPARNEATRWDA